MEKLGWCLLPVTLVLSGEDMQIGLVGLPANLAEAASCSSVKDVASNKDTTKITKMKSHGERQVATSVLTCAFVSGYAHICACTTYRHIYV